MNSIFKHYDIRGIWNKELTSEKIESIAKNINKEFKPKRVLIARDTRRSGLSILKILKKNICATIIDAEVTSTPMFYFIMNKHDFDLGIMITASHNPKEYNGLKIWKKKQPLLYSEIKLLSKNQENKKNKCKNKIDTQTFTKEYYEFFLRKIKPFNKQIKLIIDYSNGAGKIYSNLLKKYVKLTEINKTGDFIHQPNPLLPESQRTIKKKLKTKEHDLGVVFDGDADRIVFIDERTRTVLPEEILVVLAKKLAKNSCVVQTINMSKQTKKILKKENIKVYESKIGYVNIRKKLIRKKAILGAETSYHFSFKDLNYSDSAIYALLNVLEAFSQSNKTRFSDFIKSQRIKTSRKEHVIKNKNINLKELDKALRKEFKPLKIQKLDGISYFFKDYWFNIRKSNTEPKIKITIEAKTCKRNKLILKKIKKLIT